LLNPFVLVLVVSKSDPARNGMLRVTSFASVLGLRVACADGDRRACVRLGIILGEHRERHEEWRREHPDVFFYER
jgi:hypothetical protein